MAEEKSESFELLNEGEEYIKQLDYKNVIFRQYDRTFRNLTAGDPNAAGNGVIGLEVAIAPYEDKSYLDEMKKIEEKYRKMMTEIANDQDPKLNKQELINILESEKIRDRFKQVGLLLKRKAIIK